MQNTFFSELQRQRQIADVQIYRMIHDLPYNINGHETRVGKGYKATLWCAFNTLWKEFDNILYCMTSNVRFPFIT